MARCYAPARWWWPAARATGGLKSKTSVVSRAAVFLASYARKVLMIIRGGGLGASMSRYLIERVEATPNIELLFNTEVVALEGTQDVSLERVRWRSRLSGEESTTNIRNLFLFAG